MTNEELTMAILESAEAIKKNIQPNKLLDYITNLQGEKEDYKSRCENAYEELTYMSSSDYVEDYDIKQNCWIKLSNILQNESDEK